MAIKEAFDAVTKALGAAGADHDALARLSSQVASIDVDIGQRVSAAVAAAVQQLPAPAVAVTADQFAQLSIAINALTARVATLEDGAAEEAAVVTPAPVPDPAPVVAPTPDPAPADDAPPVVEAPVTVVPAADPAQDDAPHS